MRVTPKTDEELSNVWDAGWYPATIENAVERVSKKGQDMLVVTLTAYDNKNGRSKLLTDYIVESVAYKVKHICVACGVLDDYEQGVIDPQNLVSVNVDVKLKITQDKDGVYPDKNDVGDYRESTAPKAKADEKKSDSKPTGVPVQQQRQAAKATPTEDCPF